MKILGLETSGMVAGTAIVEDGLLLAEYTLNYKKTHSQTLLPMLEELRNMLELDMESIDAIAVAAGPGSFTGLRIGSATAKGLGMALEIPIVEIPTLEGLAYNLWGTDALVCPLIDARRNQVYGGIYEFQKVSSESGKGREQECCLCTVETQKAVDVSYIIERLNRLWEEEGREVIFVGDGIPVYRQVLAEQLKLPYSFAPAGKNRQCAGSVAALGEIYYRQGRWVTPAAHQPEYLRKSQAERELAEKNAQLSQRS